MSPFYLIEDSQCCVTPVLKCMGSGMEKALWPFQSGNSRRLTDRTRISGRLRRKFHQPDHKRLWHTGVPNAPSRHGISFWHPVYCQSSLKQWRRNRCDRCKGKFIKHHVLVKIITHDPDVRVLKQNLCKEFQLICPIIRRRAQNETACLRGNAASSCS